MTEMTEAARARLARYMSQARGSLAGCASINVEDVLRDIQEHVDREKKRISIFSKYLPRIAQFSAMLAGKERVPDIEKLLKSVQKYGAEEE